VSIEKLRTDIGGWMERHSFEEENWVLENGYRYSPYALTVVALQ
jgi:hypothetical protein